MMPFYVWLILAIIFTLVEIFTTGFFYACFAIGAVAAWATGLLTPNPIWQILVFCIVSVGLIPLTRIFARRVTDESIPQAGADALIGIQGIVLEAINSHENLGKVRVENQEWRASASVDIGVGTKIKVVAVKGATLLVEPNSGKEK
jgi:membrane protein implicated in regulation of membrane protease activity